MDSYRDPPITSFDGDYRWLSNFWPAEVELDGVTYRTVEHAYQAAKTLSPAGRIVVRACESAAQAKQAGKKVPMRSDWADVKISVMRDLLRQKFNHGKNQDLWQKLQDTGSAELIEGNHWNDTFWGVCRGVGENHLGKLLMNIREAYLMLEMCCYYPGDVSGNMQREACELLGVPYEPPEVIITYGEPE